MIILRGHSLSPGAKIRPEAMGLTLEERGGNVAMTLGPEHPDIGIDAWLKDDTEPGKGVIWRVRSQDNNYETGTRTVNLEHMIRTLADRVIPGEITAGDMGGGDVVSARNAAEKVLSYQSDWRLGNFDFGAVAEPFSFNGQTLFAALEIISNACEDAEWRYDFGVYPFRLHIVRRQTGASAEMRPGRNLTTIRKTIDRSGMYTRLYPIGADDLRLPEGYVSANEGIYGVIEKVETDQTIESEEALRSWARNRVRRHAEPKVTVTISGLELSQTTGESLDKLQIGKVCRVPMPEIGTTVTERISRLQWRDKIADPEGVNVTLANVMDDVASILRREAADTAEAGAKGAGRAKKAGEDHAWFVDTTEKVGMVAEAVAGPGASKDWSRVSEIIVDGEGIHQRVTQTEGELVVAETRIDANEKRILLEAKARADDDAQLRSSLTVQADQIRAEVEARQAQGNTLSGQISAQAGKISLVVEEKNGQNVVKAASIVTAINDSGSEILLNADKIKLNGAVTVGSLLGGSSSGQLKVNGSVLAEHYYLGTGAVPTASIEYGMYDLRLTQNGNVYTLQKQIYADSEWRDIGTFSRATSLSGAWSGGTYTATASPQGNTCSTTLQAMEGTGEVTTAGKWVSRDFIIQYGPDGDHLSSTGAQLTASINASDVWEAGRDSVTHSPTISSVWTRSSSPPGSWQQLNSLKTQYEAAKDDGDYFCIEVNCNGATKTYYCAP